MHTITLRNKDITPCEVEKAVKVLNDNGLVIFPTDTVYGLAGSAYSSLAIEKIYQLKQRPKDKPFIIFVPDIDFIKKINIKITPKIKNLLQVFWPGAVTFVFKKNLDDILPQLGGKIAVRIPEHPVVLAILKGFNDPLVVTSANISGEGSPFDFDQIGSGILEKTDLAIDAGRCKLSVISTIVDVSESKLKILREGAIPAEEILKVWNNKASIGEINGKKVNKSEKDRKY
ncbi:MAG: L-threonylcarbamoyladenylate synthase [bacterium]|nr:L-threonylcarbamoyladenylate synthase [bacterium]